MCLETSKETFYYLLLLKLLSQNNIIKYNKTQLLFYYNYSFVALCKINAPPSSSHLPNVIFVKIKTEI